jgi:hypothetical protein
MRAPEPAHRPRLPGVVLDAARILEHAVDPSELGLEAHLAVAKARSP